MKVVIVGGVAGGASAAARLRRLDETAEIIMFERTGYISYANCGLPYYIGGVIQEESALTLQTPSSFRGRFAVDVRIRHEVVDIFPEKQCVLVKNLETKELFEETYDKLILSPGARPTLPQLDGVNLSQVFTLRTVEDTLKLHHYIEEHQPHSVVMAGGGFISLELAENLRELGMEVTIVQRPKQVMNPLDGDMACFLHSEIRKHGIVLKLGHTVESLTQSGEQITVSLQDGNPIVTDMVVIAMGVTPDTYLAEKAGLQQGLKGSIVVNDHMETSFPNIYAVGDAVQVNHVVTGEETLLSLAGPANRQGRIVADNIAGIPSAYGGSQGSSVLKCFDLTMANTGINENTAKRLGLNYDKVYLSPANHAGYYPGGTIMNMKVLFEKETYRLLGAQIVGQEGVDKRIDVLATAIHCHMTAPQLKNLDLSYAPPYSSAKDPVNLVGLMTENMVNGLFKQFFWHDIETLPHDGSVTLLDTRTVPEYEKGHIDGFSNIPLDKLRENLDQLDVKKPLYIHCQSGLRSYVACRMLAQYGYNVYNLSGGYRHYEAVTTDKHLIWQAHPCGMDK